MAYKYLCYIWRNMQLLYYKTLRPEILHYEFTSSFQFVVPVRTLCNGDLDRNLKFEVYDHNKSGNHSYIGEFFATARNLIEQKSGSSFTCVNLKKKVCVLYCK